MNMFSLTVILIGVISVLFYCCQKWMTSSGGFKIAMKKFLVHWYLFHMKRKQQKLFQFDAKLRDTRTTGIAATDQEWYYEQCRPLNSSSQATDSVEFFGIDNNGNAMVARITRRHHRTAEICIYLKLSSGDEYQSIIHPDMQMVNVDERKFSAGGLTLEVLDPLRTWRIIFRGILRKGIRNEWDQSDQEVVDVCFNFIWRPAYHHFVLNENFNIKMLTDAISDMKDPWKFLSTFKLNSDEYYEQWGQMSGTYQIDNQDEIKLNLWGPKIRSHGIKNTDQRLRMHLHAKDGTVISLQTQQDFYGIENVTHGYVVRASNFGRDSISKIDINSSKMFQEKEFLETLNVNLTARTHEYALKISAEKFGFSLFGRENWPCEMRTKIVKGFMNENEVSGFLEISHPYSGSCPLPLGRKSLPLLKEIDVANVKSHVLSLVDPSCRNSNLVGGKGASLALMMTIKAGDEKFEIPPGICLTRDAFFTHIMENLEIKKNIQMLENVAWRKVEGSLQQLCEKVIDTILISKISSATKNAIQEQLSYIFGDKFEAIPFAIRSSAIGEDGEEMSAAGQNETFLGIIGFANICESILKCWASQFSYRSVEYKRQNGQLLNGGMAVVIQQMVPSDVSGVMFTAHPAAGQFGYVTITANYGLGESVVSASSDPDTIILRRSWDDQLKIHHKVIGKKQSMIVLRSEGGTEEKQTKSEVANNWTLSDELALKLGRVGILLDQSYGNPRDIEWSLQDDQLFLLQCRPITTHLQPTQFEIYHEFDSPRITEDECFTRANVGEVMPGALTPLTITTLFRVWAIVSEVIMTPKVERHWYTPLLSNTRGSITYFNHFLGDRMLNKLIGLSEKSSPALRAIQLGIHGRVIDDTVVHEKALKRYPIPNLVARLRTSYYSFVTCLLLGGKMLKKAKKRVTNYTIATECIQNTEDLYQKLDSSAFDGLDMYLAHIAVSTGSMIWNLFLLNALAGSIEYTLDQYNDFAVLIGKSIGAFSGDVPLALKELAKSIFEKTDPNEFSSMTREAALHWIKTNPDISIKFQEFMDKHGHRGYKEFELSAIPWRMDPVKLVEALQKIVTVTPLEETVKPEETINDTFAKLKTPLTPFKRKILAFIFPKCQNAIRSREASKTLLIKISDEMRKGYLKLGEMLMHEGKIVDPRLIFFFTHEEIGRLIKSRSASLINRATRRQRAFPYMDSVHFREMVDGQPKTIEEEEEEESENNVSASPTEERTKLTAYPVCQGIVKGPARVILNFANIDQIMPGDILITHGTDIAWSPYFPILAGIVTEIGGLISHGAVVAREYGLPCIIAAEGATKIFKSGDMVLLNASKGTVEKISE